MLLLDQFTPYVQITRSLLHRFTTVGSPTFSSFTPAVEVIHDIYSYTAIFSQGFIPQKSLPFSLLQPTLTRQI